MVKGLPKVKIAKELIKRLNFLPRSGTFSGCVYGLPSSLGSKQNFLVWTATGKQREEKQAKAETTGNKDFEVLTEALPCGIDPIGVFLVQESDDVDMERIHGLIGSLPEAFLAASDPVVITRNGSDGKLRILLHNEGSLIDADMTEVSGEELAKETQVVRVKGKLSINCPKKELDIQNAFRHLIEKVSCPYGTFGLQDSSVHFVHTWTMRRKNTGVTGWATAEGDVFSEEDQEECIVTNLHEYEVETVRDLWQCVTVEGEDEDDGFGPAEVKKKKAKVVEKEALNFNLVMKMSGEACTTKTLNCAPVVHYEKREFDNVYIPLKIDSIGVVRKDMPVRDLMEILKGCVQRQVHEMGRSVLSELKIRNSISLPETFHMKPEPLSHFCSIVYNKNGTCKQFAEFRRHLHSLLLLPVERPLFRRMNAYVFEGELPKDGPLRNVHEGIKMGATGGNVSLIQGTYAYHHYMQDRFDDDGWGCAYRSLQTIVSWFRIQGYCGSTVPTHEQIQKVLVDIEDKPKSFIGSKQWIGSTEVGFVVEKVCGVESKFLSVSSGEDLAGKGRELEQHFKTNGTPIMIGGGVLAHTILGVDWNESTGDIRWLILDPHFTGQDYLPDGKPNLAHMQQKGWVGWKGPDFWVKGAFYNMCMPQRPVHW